MPRDLMLETVMQKKEDFLNLPRKDWTPQVMKLQALWTFPSRPLCLTQQQEGSKLQSEGHPHSTS